MMKFMDRYCARLAIAFACLAIIVTPGDRELGWMAVAFLAGMSVEPWVQRFENR